jgi:hypothetical protein
MMPLPMTVPGRLWIVSRVLALALVCSGCPHKESAPPVETVTPRRQTFTSARIRSFSDSYAVTAVADTQSTLYVGTPRGLVRWDAGRWSVMSQKDGLPADRVAGLAVDGSGTVWIATAKGLSRGLRGAWTNYAAAPVGSFLTGLIPGGDGKIVWAGGPEGLARLSHGKWERYFGDTGVTALTSGWSGTIWVGTSGTGILRIARGGDRVERFGPSQGCEIDVVRGMVAVNKTLFVVGEGPGGARAAFYDGERFYSYTLTSPSVIEWTARAGNVTLLGSGDHVYELAMAPPPQGEGAPRPAVRLTPIPSSIVPARSIALKPDVPSATLDDPPNSPKPPSAATAINANKGAAPPPLGPPVSVSDAAWSLPEGVTAVAGSERGLLVGTRFLGTVRVENGVPRRFQIQDLAQNAVRLTVACVQNRDECYLATGTTRAWRFDGQAFEIAPVDPEPGSHVLAVLLDPQGDVLAIHRGAQESDRQLRLSRVSDGRWTPVGIQAVEVPEGAPDLNFAGFSPDGHLWVGLRYTDREHDARDYGADEIALDTGKVIRHGEVPSDVVAMFWKARNEAWFATRSGAARLLDGKMRVFTENDGMESDITRDIGPGPGGTILVATGRGTGRYDGTRWTFPRLGPFYPASNSLAHDRVGNAFVGTVRGLYCVGDCSGDPIDKRRGLSDDDVRNIEVDPRGRVWVLTEKGINIVEP